jgi:GLPGLI family protein
MKQTILFFSFLLITLLLRAQGNPPASGNSGTIIYEQVVQLEIKLEGESAQFANMLPKERKTQKVLYFNSSGSLYENKPVAEDQTMRTEAGGAVMIRMMEPDNKVFTDLSNNRQVEKREFMTREFLIETNLDLSAWKLTGNQKMILNYPSQEAVRETKEGKTSAWFTPVIPVSAGPGVYNGLPGLVLAVNINDGKQLLTAISIDLNPVAEDVINKPDKGKKVTKEEFDKIVEEKMKEMGETSPGGGNRVMIRIHP